MNAHLPPPLIPENAPFSPAQRAWLNGFFAGLLSSDGQAASAAGLATPVGPGHAAPVEDDGDYPWHDPAIELDERLELADGRAFDLKLMAAMGQLDCGQCGYDCRDYARKIADGSEGQLNLCVPGGRSTQRALKRLLAETGDVAPAVEPPAAPTSGRPEAVLASFKAADRLTAASSDKDVRHVVIDLAGTDLDYVPGDSLGVHATNDPALVEAIAARLDGLSEVEALTQERDLRTVTEPLLRLMADHAGLAEAATLKALADADDDSLDEDDVLDVLERFPSARPPARSFVDTLDALQPRLYSISSSPRRHGREVHLTIAVTRTDKDARLRNGVASTFFAERIAPGTPIRVYRQAAHDFALPESGATPIVMVGPGTGIAPFRAFLEERAETGASGPAWLFFGNPHEATDYLYRDELEAFREAGTLTRLDVAFSRDQAAKVYVQDRIREGGARLWRWLQERAHVYVCGDAKRMAKDVDDALADVAATHGGEDGRAFLKSLAAAGRYQRDVY
ncbi:MAG: sulfite reductase subunit alpha [Pseudomonadota bacterium]